jgi:tetratricopeptide (TPR) repeat protein
MRAFPSWALPLALTAGLATSSPAQSETATIATAFVAAQVPAKDDPDATAVTLVRTALAHRQSPVAHVLVSDVLQRLGDVQQPAALLAEVPEAAALTACHGRLAQRLLELRWQLDYAIGGRQHAGPLPAMGYTHELQIAGPFGDAGDHFAGCVYPPELRFPAADEVLPGRGGQARVRVARVRPLDDYLFWRHRQDPRVGCYYGRQRHQVDVAIDAFLEVECSGDHQLFVDGSEVLRVERWQATAPCRHYVALHLPAGEHEVLLKLASNDSERCTLRFVDAGCRPVTAIRQLPTDAQAPPERAAKAVAGRDTFVTAVDTLAKAAAAGDPTLGIAAAWLALADGDGDRALALLAPLRQTPPTEPTLALALARLLARAPLPDETRRAEARARIEACAESMLPDHHTARLLLVQLREEQDQREQGLRLLRAHPAPGPETLAREFQLLRQLKFRAEERPLLMRWRAAWPHDPEPAIRLAELATAVGDQAEALRLRRELLAQRSILEQAVATIRNAAAVGDTATANSLIDAFEPAFPGERMHTRLHLQLEVRIAAGDTDAALATMRELLASDDSDAGYLRQLASKASAAGDPELAAACQRRSLELDPDQPALRRLVAGTAEPGDDALLAAYRRDGSAAAKAFVVGPREDTAGTTVLIDQRLVVVEADGSWTAEVHELRRINDQNGVDAFSEGAGLGDAGEILLVRTLATDGNEYVPARIENDYALQQLQPGAFVEWRVRDRGKAPGANALRDGAFLFGAADEPCAVTEWIVVLPPTFPGELRSRGLGEPTEQRELPDGRRLFVYRRSDVPILAKERFRPSPFTLLPTAQLGADPSPLPPNRMQRIEMLTNTRPLAPIQAAAETLFATAASPRAKAELAWQHVQTTIEAGPANDALTTLLRQKGDRLLLFVALLRAASVPVTPLLAQEVRPELNNDVDSLFAADPWTVPGAWIEFGPDDGVPVFADTPRHWPFGRVPAQRRGTQALLLLADGVAPILLPGSADAVQQIRVRGTAKVDGGKLALTAELELGDMQGFGLADRLREAKANTQKQAARQIASQLFEGWRVENAKAVFEPKDRPLRLAVELTRGGVQTAGDITVLPLPLAPNKLVTKFGDRAERTLPWQFTGDLAIDWQIELDLGDALRPRSLPAPLLLQRPPLWFEQSCAMVDGRIVCRRQLRLGSATLPASEFADWMRVLQVADRAEAATIEAGPR